MSQAGRGNVKVIAVDFDGVIHSYDKGWQDGKIYGQMLPGFLDWLYKVEKHFRVVVHTSRSPRAVQSWLEERGVNVVVTNEKPPAWAYIDDRGIQFQGNWNAPEISVDSLLEFRPWNLREQEP